jgi:hypothetical protein
MLSGAVYYAEVNDKARNEGGNLEIEMDDGSDAYNFSVGYSFNKWVAIESGHWWLGEFNSSEGSLFTGSTSDLTAKSNAWTVGVLGFYPLGNFDIYGRLGAAWWETKFERGRSDNILNRDRRFEIDGGDPYFGLGGTYNINETVGIYVEWTRFAIDTDIDLFGIGVRLTY